MSIFITMLNTDEGQLALIRLKKIFKLTRLLGKLLVRQKVIDITPLKIAYDTHYDWYKNDENGKEYVIRYESSQKSLRNTECPDFVSVKCLVQIIHRLIGQLPLELK